MSSTSDRLHRLERALPPQEAVLVWLSEAHAHGSLLAYLRTTIDLPLAQAPRSRIIARITTYERARQAGRTRQDVDAAIAQGAREAIFGYELILVIETETASFIDRLDPLLGLVYHQAVEQVVECREAVADRPCPFRHWAPATARLAVERFEQEHEARRQLEDRYLRGRSVLFPETAERWTRVADTAAVITGLIDSAPLCTADGPPTPGQGLDDTAEQVGARADALVDYALIATHRYFGEEHEAHAIARRRILAVADPAPG